MPQPRWAQSCSFFLCLAHVTLFALTAGSENCQDNVRDHEPGPMYLHHEGPMRNEAVGGVMPRLCLWAEDGSPLAPSFTAGSLTFSSVRLGFSFYQGCCSRRDCLGGRMSDPGVGSELGACAQESRSGLEVCPRCVRARLL